MLREWCGGERGTTPQVDRVESPRALSGFLLLLHSGRTRAAANGQFQFLQASIYARRRLQRLQLQGTSFLLAPRRRVSRPWSQSTSSPKITQSRLPSVGRKPLITPRGSSSTKKPKAGDRNVRSMFKQQASVTPSAARRRPSPAYAKESHSADEGEEGAGSSSGRDEGKASGFGRDASSSWTRQPHLGRKIINPPPSQRRRGPTISFDDDEEPPYDDTEMQGEEFRRRRKRVQEGGGKGQLDLVPAEDHEGFDYGTARPKKKLRRQLEFLTEGELSANEGEDADAEEDADEEREDEETMTVDMRPVANNKEEIIVVAEESSSEPETLEESLDLNPNALPILAQALPPVTLPSDQLPASSLSSDDESFQHRLVPASHPWPPSKAAVLVPNSDDDDDCAELATRIGQGGADDSGFAEMEEDPKEATQSPSLTFESMPEETIYSLHPAPLRQHISKVDVYEFESPLFETMLDETFSSLYTAPSQKLPVDDETQDRTNSLVRTASAILMPPPPLPRRSTSLSQSPRKDSAPRGEILVATSPAPLQHSPPSHADPQPSTNRRIVLVPDTQYSLPCDHLPALSQSSHLSQAFDDDDVCKETRFPEALPIASTSTLPLVLPRPAPKRDSTAAAWSGVASAWEGQHIEPPQPVSPRQTRLSEFFAALPPREDENAVIEDSQTPWDGVTLAQASAFALALEATRARGRTVERIVQEVDGEEEIEDLDGEEEDEHAMVPSSDHEDGPWSPLGSRLAPRPFEFSFASPSPSPTKSTSPTAHQSSNTPLPVDHWSCKASDGSLIWIPRLPPLAPIDLASKNLPEGIDEATLEASYYWVVRRAMEEAPLPEGMGELVEQARSWVKAKERWNQAQRFRILGLGKPVRGAEETQEEE